jgi:hypothetical protein
MKKWIKEYQGFESLIDVEEDILWAFEQENVVPNGEWIGKLVITMEYFPEEDNDYYTEDSGE